MQESPDVVLHDAATKCRLVQHEHRHTGVRHGYASAFAVSLEGALLPAHVPLPTVQPSLCCAQLTSVNTLTFATSLLYYVCRRGTDGVL